jgi:hypothetical protein
VNYMAKKKDSSNPLKSLFGNHTKPKKEAEKSNITHLKTKPIIPALSSPTEESARTSSTPTKEPNLVTRYAIDKFVDGGIDRIENALKDPEPNGILTIGYFLTQAGERLLGWHQDIKTRQEKEHNKIEKRCRKQEELKNQAIQDELRQNQAIKNEFKEFLQIVEELRINNLNIIKEKFEEDKFWTKEELRTHGEKEYVERRKAKIEELYKKKVEIKEKYIFRPDKNKIIFGPNIRQWWVDKKFPTDDEGHPRIFIDPNDFKQDWFFACNLHACNLSDSNFEGLKLQYANLQAAILTGVNFTGTSLVGAHLDGANISRAFVLSQIQELITGLKLIEYLQEQAVSTNETIVHQEIGEMLFDPRKSIDTKPKPTIEIFEITDNKEFIVEKPLPEPLPSTKIKAYAVVKTDYLEERII